MNDEDRDLLSAYLDGALGAEPARALEARLAASPELRRELEELKALSRRLKALPKPALPEGFLVRFQARRARGEAPKREWSFLPPLMRPAAAALSFGVVALVLWDRMAAPPEPALIHPPSAANVVTAAQAPVAQLALKEDAAPASPSAPVPEAFPARRIMAKAARAAGRPLEAPEVAATAADYAGPLSEEDRSRRNEQNFANLELQKKKMGIARVLARQDAAQDSEAKVAAAPALASNAPSMLKGYRGAAAGGAVASGRKSELSAAGRVAQDAGLIVSDAKSLAASWTLLGFPGDPPAVDFAARRVVLIKPSGTKILSVTSTDGVASVRYRLLTEYESADPVRDRFADIPADSWSVVFVDQSSR
jgi:hypothetical protein